MATNKKLAAELQTKLQNAKAAEKYVNKVLEFIEEEVREIEQRDLELREGSMIRDCKERLIAEKGLQLLEKEAIIAEKSERLSQLEEELAAVAVKLNCNALLVTERDQELKMKKLQVQQLELQIKRAAKSQTKQVDDERN